MALPYARSQLVRYLTDKVIENVTKQLAQQAAAQPFQAAGEGAAAPASPDLQRLVESINAAFAQTYDQIEALEARIGQVELRMRKLERRWSWQTLAKVAALVVFAFLLGLLASQILGLGGGGL